MKDTLLTLLTSKRSLIGLLTALADWIEDGKRPEPGELARVMSSGSADGGK